MSLVAQCFGSCFWFGCSSAFQEANPYLGHLLIFLLSCVFSIIMGMVVQGSYKLPYINYETEVCTSDACAGNSAIFRTSFVLSIYFLLHAVVMLVPRTESFHGQCLFFKFMCLLACIVGTFWMGQDFFKTYGDIAMVGSVFYLVFQCMILINWSYEVSAWLLARSTSQTEFDEEGNPKGAPCSLWLLFFLTIAGFVLEYTGLGLSVKYFGGNGCDRNNFFVAFSIICTTVLIVYSLCHPRPKPLAASVVLFYCVYLLQSGLYADPDKDCNEMYHEDNKVFVWIGMVIAGVSLSYGAYCMANTDLYHKTNVEEDEAADGKKNNQGLLGAEEKIDDEDKKEEKADRIEEANDENEEAGENEGEINPRSQYFKFHAVMMFASMYMAMLFTGWGNLTDESHAFTHSNTIVWINIATQWIVYALYGWTLVASHMWPDSFPDGTETSD